MGNSRSKECIQNILQRICPTIKTNKQQNIQTQNKLSQIKYIDKQDNPQQKKDINLSIQVPSSNRINVMISINTKLTNLLQILSKRNIQQVQLRVDQMKLQYNNRQLSQNLTQIKNLKTNSVLIYMRKADVSNKHNIKGFRIINDTNGTKKVQLPCKHVIYNQDMIKHIFKQLNSGATQAVKCFQKGCNILLDLIQLKKVFVFTKTQISSIQNISSINALNQQNDSQSKIQYQIQKEIISIKQLKVTLLNKDYLNIKLNGSDQLTDIKSFIYSHFDQLSTTQMDLYYNNNILSQSLSQIKNDNNNLIILQQKRGRPKNNKNIPNIKVGAQQLDPLTFQYQNFVTMPCGHKITQQSLVIYILRQLSRKSATIMCNKSNAVEQCKIQWPFSQLKKIFNFTKSQKNKIQTQLSENLLSKITIKCRLQLHNIVFQPNVKRIKCPAPQCAKESQYCKICKKNWKGQGDKDCGNVNCNNQIQNYLNNVPWNFKFSLNNASKIVSAPLARICPLCKNLLQIKSGCNIFPCNHCNRQFCWMCLNIVNSSNKKCGSWVDCGFLAPTQNINALFS